MERNDNMVARTSNAASSGGQLPSENSDDVRSEEENDTLRGTLAVTELLGSSETKTKRDLPTLSQQ
jgi:hypothetical protein